MALLLLVLQAACSRAPEPAPVAATAPAAAPLRLAIDLWPGFYPAVLADELGYFKARGLAVEISVPGVGDRMLGQFAAGELDLVGIALGDLIDLSRTRPDVVLLLASDESAGGDAVLQRKDLDLASAGRLRIGTKLGGFGELFVREYLQRQQIDAATVDWIDVEAEQVPAALAEGRIDLGHCWEPHVSQAIAGGARQVFSSAETPGLIVDVIATTRALSDSRAADLRAFNAAWFEALTWWQAHPDEGNRLLGQRLQLAPGSIRLTGMRLLDLYANRRALGANGQAELAATLARYSDFFVQRGSLSKALDPAQVLVPALLP